MKLKRRWEIILVSVAGNPLIRRSSPPEICSGYHLSKSSLRFFELLIGAEGENLIFKEVSPTHN
ncbi:unnamed protein product [Brassica oleracea var. botrytis]|uniref:Uncharacterized protein n=2 Tax=Brassica TaxID=3705 RepID=A0A3P6EIH9_BRAOL|nr:hypothetical protein HID58_074102 [Brassica napus]CAF1948455.1 unnamed protein product [Brassica napus]VDD35184.1 unnamed protein product [Brassica oleracea]